MQTTGDMAGSQGRARSAASDRISLQVFGIRRRLGMNFDFSDEQKEIGRQVRRVLERVCPMSEVKRCLSIETTSSAIRHGTPAWQALADLGVLGAAVPQALGGAGLGRLELAAAAEEIGRACVPAPTLASIYLATECLLLNQHAAGAAEWLARLSRGEAFGCVAVSDNACRAFTLDDNGRVHGALRVLPGADVATFAIVFARAADHDALATTAVLVPLTQTGVTREPARALDAGLSIGSLRMDGAAAQPLAAPGTGEALRQRLLDHAAVLLAFEQLGGAERALEMACAYARQRRSFGRLIGSYQAIKHKLADVYVKNQLARAHAYFGAWALATDAPELPLAACGAHLAASQAFQHAAQENVQVHGGFGFTWEADCHPLFKRAQSSSLALGSQAMWRRRLITRLPARATH